MTTTHSPDPAPLALEERAPGRTSPSHPLTFRIGAALDLKEPAIKEANGSNLDPIATKDRLTVVVPANTALRPDDQLSVTWTGGPGTPAGGSHTTLPRPVNEGLEVPIPNSVVAFNLGQSVSVSYMVVRGGSPKPSQVLNLTVQKIANNDPNLTQATIDGFPNNDLNVTTLANNALTRVPPWPLIAANQKIWLRYRGTKADGSTYRRATYEGTPMNGNGVIVGPYPPTPVADLRGLKHDSNLHIEFSATYNGSTNEADAVTFPERIYTVKAVEDVKPVVSSIKDSKGTEILEGGITVDTIVTLTGTASKGQTVQVLDGSTPKGEPTADPVTGIWTLTVSGLTVAAHSFTAKALYGSGQVSAARTLTVTAVVAPTITSVKGSPSGVEIPNAGLTVETRITLTGAASKGQKVDVLDGTVSKGQPTADPATGVWTLDVTGLTVAAHSFTAKALYGSGTVSAPWTFTVVAELVFDTSPINSNRQLYIWHEIVNDVLFFGSSRQATGGRPPYVYSSSNLGVANVTSAGRVRVLGRGTTTITVRDQAGQSKSYNIFINGAVFECFDLAVATYSQIESTAKQRGLRLPTMTETSDMSTIYKGGSWPVRDTNGTWFESYYSGGQFWGITYMYDSGQSANTSPETKRHGLGLR